MFKYVFLCLLIGYYGVNSQQETIGSVRLKFVKHDEERRKTTYTVAPFSRNVKSKQEEKLMFEKWLTKYRNIRSVLSKSEKNLEREEPNRPWKNPLFSRPNKTFQNYLPRLLRHAVKPKNSFKATHSNSNIPKSLLNNNSSRIRTSVVSSLTNMGRNLTEKADTLNKRTGLISDSKERNFTNETFSSNSFSTTIPVLNKSENSDTPTGMEIIADSSLPLSPTTSGNDNEENVLYPFTKPTTDHLSETYQTLTTDVLPTEDDKITTNKDFEDISIQAKDLDRNEFSFQDQSTSTDSLKSDLLTSINIPQESSTTNMLVENQRAAKTDIRTMLDHSTNVTSTVKNTNQSHQKILESHSTNIKMEVTTQSSDVTGMKFQSDSDLETYESTTLHKNNTYLNIPENAVTERKTTVAIHRHKDEPDLGEVRKIPVGSLGMLELLTISFACVGVVLLFAGFILVAMSRKQKSIPLTAPRISSYRSYGQV